MPVHVSDEIKPRIMDFKYYYVICTNSFYYTFVENIIYFY